ncbi:MAG: hypothetical protein LBL34_01695 [Clostridiales bacterium]|jgi:hypothetical protein|nr:hypothetical protein [Clostridiales bacterium]
MRRLLTVGLCLILAFSFTGCSSKKLAGITLTSSFGVNIHFPESWSTLGDKWEFDKTQDMLTFYHKVVRSKYGDDKLATLFTILKFPKGEGDKDNLYAPTYELGEFNGYVYRLTTPLESSYGIQLADGVLAKDYDDMAKDIPDIAKEITLGEFTHSGPAYINPTPNLADIEHPIFYPSQEQEANKAVLAEYLFSQSLELGKQGKAVTSQYNNGKEWVNNYDTLDEYIINEINNVEFIGNEIKFTVSFDVKPTTGIASDWTAGNGISSEKEGWIVRKFLFVSFEKIDEGYRKGDFATGP